MLPGVMEVQAAVVVMGARAELVRVRAFLPPLPVLEASPVGEILSTTLLTALVVEERGQ